MTDLLIRGPRLLPAPDPNPPYDCADVPWRRPQVRQEARGQGVLPLKFVLPSGLPVRPAPTVSRHDTDVDRSEVERWSRILARAIAETLSGTRSPEQLQFWLTGNAHRRLLLAVRLAGVAAPSGYAVQAVHVRTPVAGVAEANATLHAADHAHAMAFRLAFRREQWLCTALEVGLNLRGR